MMSERTLWRGWRTEGEQYPTCRVTLWIFEITEVGLSLLDPWTIGRCFALEPEVVAEFLRSFHAFPEMCQGGTEIEANPSVVGTKVKGSAKFGDGSLHISGLHERESEVVMSIDVAWL